MKTFKGIRPVPGYEHLEHILVAAYEQAAKGKGAERHANDKPFAVDAVNMLLLAAAPQPAHQEPVIDAFLLTKLNKLYEKITPPPYFAAPDNRGIGLLGGRWTKNGAFQDVTKESVARHGGSDQDNMRFIVEVVNSWEAIRAMLAAAPQPAQHKPLTEIPLLSDPNKKLRKDKEGLWELASVNGHLRYLNVFESNFVDSAIEAAHNIKETP